jgi:beta-phosphoglucomutase-like phosphatase (HAD superfamily)
VTGTERPFDSGRPRPIVTALDSMRSRIDHDGFDAAILSLDSIVADLGYGDLRPLPGSIAWIDKLRREGKRIAVAASVDRAAAALELAGISDRVDVIVTGSQVRQRVASGWSSSRSSPTVPPWSAPTRMSSPPRAPRASSS